MVLVLARGGFCPKDRRQHEGLLQLHREMQVGYCRLVTISTDNLLETNEFRSGVGVLKIRWVFTPGDANCVVQRPVAFGLRPAAAPAKDRQTVVATGFPELAGKPGIQGVGRGRSLVQDCLRGLKADTRQYATWIAVRRRVAQPVANLLTAVAGLLGYAEIRQVRWFLGKAGGADADVEGVSGDQILNRV